MSAARRGHADDRWESDDDGDWTPAADRRRIRPASRHHVTAVVGVLLTAALVFAAGSLLPAQTARQAVATAPLVGRTTSVCAVADRTGTGPDAKAAEVLSAVAVRQAPGRDGVLTGHPLAGGDPVLSVTEQGFGRQVTDPSDSVELEGVGAMATASSGAVFDSAEQGEEAGLMAEPCSLPATSHWFVGVGADDTHRTELFLGNPDDAQAEVDLRFYGRNGLVIVPGSPGLVVPAHDSRTVLLPSLVNQAGPLSVWVHATSGRVAAVARDLYSVQLDPAGADWHPSSVSPARNLVVPGVPEGGGGRDLVVANPGTTRAQVSVSVLGVQGPFGPAGADRVEVPPESTATVSLAAGLAEQSSGVQLQSDRPVSAAVVSTSSRNDESTGSPARPDISIQPAVAALGRTGVSPLATVDGTDAQLVLSNGSGTDAQVSFQVLSFDGVSLREDQMLVPAHGTSTRRLTSTPPSYLVVNAPDGPDLYGAVTFAQSSGPVAGLTTLPITSPDVAARGRRAVADPAVGR